MMLAKSLQSAAGNAAGEATYIEDVFSTYLYTGNGSTQTITNGIDLAGEGGLVWIKSRNVTGLDDNWLQDTARGIRNGLKSNSTAAQSVNADIVTAVYSTGYLDSVGWSTSDNIASWTFRKQPKFFDVVTYTGNGVAGRTVAHSLGSVPGCIIIKKTTGVESWAVYHRSLGTAQALRLNLTNAASSPYWNGTSPTATVFTVDNSGEVNDNGATYVAYLFAHNAGGFGDDGEQDVVSCGSFTTDGSGQGVNVNLGYEPQWLLFKSSSAADDWNITDTMRGFNQTQDAELKPNTSNAEYVDNRLKPVATGFVSGDGALAASTTFIYIAIRRGPMKTPTTGTEVFDPAAYTGAAAPYRTVSTAIKGGVDMVWNSTRALATNVMYVMDRLRGNQGLRTSSSTSEGTENVWQWDVSSGVNVRDGDGTSGYTYIDYAFKRAPGFFDEVCYTGDGVVGRAVTHNLGVAPELLIVKRRNAAANWVVGSAHGPGWGYVSILNSTSSFSLTGEFTPSPTSSVFSVSDSGGVNASGDTYVAYLFASCPGVSKCGSYTGTGTTQQINCGFTSGARFVLIKRTDSSGGWYVWDTARGIVSGNDPYLLLNSTAAEVTSTDYIDPVSSGFEISSTAPAAINASGGSYIYLAIA